MNTPSANDSFSNKMAVYFMMSFRQLCIVTVSLPVVTLLLCFITACIFQYEEVHETHCQVYNIIPSISAITGISPQRYLWRICVALHIGPRFIIASVYYTYHSSLFQVHSDPKLFCKCRRLLNRTYWLNIIEICSLCGVTYISNRENYPLHEKMFIIFMISSLTHMLANIKLLSLAKSLNAIEGPMENVTKSLYIKKVIFFTSIVATVSLLIFFLKHRLLCHDMAFSWFALSEYIIASANMAFHITVIFDFPTEKLLVASGAPHLENSPYLSVNPEWKSE